MRTSTQKTLQSLWTAARAETPEEGLAFLQRWATHEKELLESEGATDALLPVDEALSLLASPEGQAEVLAAVEAPPT